MRVTMKEMPKHINTGLEYWNGVDFFFNLVRILVSASLFE